MSKIKHLLAVIIGLTLVAAQVVSVQASQPSQVGTVTGTIVSVTQGTDSSNNTIIIVTFTDSNGVTQTANLTVDQAVALNLVTVDGVGNITIIAVPGDSITLDASLIEVDPCTLPEGSDQPVGEALTGFFCGSLGVDYTTIEDWHAAGYGFGVIAQALFMAQTLGGDSALADAILAAKKSGDYSTLGLPEGVVVNNWGQLKKYVMSSEVKSLTNLGAIMSGRATPPTPAPTAVTSATTTTTTITTAPLHGKSGKHGKGHGHGKGH